MQKDDTKLEFFHVKIEFKPYPFKGFLIDLSQDDLIRFLVHPYYASIPVFIEGKPIPSKEIRSFKVIKTGFSVQTSILEWDHERKSIDSYFSYNLSFEQYKDYSPLFFQFYDKSPTQIAITELLDQESMLKREQVNLIVQGGDEILIKEYDDKVRRIGGQITYLIGAFVCGVIEHIH